MADHRHVLDGSATGDDGHANVAVLPNVVGTRVLAPLGEKKLGAMLDTVYERIEDTERLKPTASSSAPRHPATMAPISNLFAALLALGSVEVLASPTAALLGDLLDIVSLDIAPLVTEVVTTTYPATAPTTYTTSSYDTGCQCHYSTIFWWTPPHHHPHPHPTSYPPGYPTTSPTAPVTVTVTETTTVPTTTTVTATATVTEPCTPTLSCDKYGYLIQDVTLFKVDLSTGEYSTVKESVGDGTSINALAYNTLDNFLYARQSGNNELIRIASDGTAEVVTKFPDATGAFVGDIDTDGNYWYGTGDTWFQMDLAPGSATYGAARRQGHDERAGARRRRRGRTSPRAGRT
ncbi:hypothetical protein EKO27_g12070, partial [Xylaria grammica]